VSYCTTRCRSGTGQLAGCRGFAPRRWSTLRPTVPFNVTMLLADSAQAVGGKLYILGAGWSMRSPTPTPCAIALHIRITPDLAGTKHRVLIELLDAAGNPVVIDTDEGRQAICASGTILMERPEDVSADAPIDANLALNFMPIPLSPGASYVWRLSINGETHDEWTSSFLVRETPNEP
jgi:hypothetical protein